MQQGKDFLYLYIEQKKYYSIGKNLYFTGKLIIKKVKGILLKDIEDKIINRNSKVSKQDTLYFLRNCNVPRFKVREKFNVTTKIENSSKLVIPSSLSTIKDDPLIEYLNGGLIISKEQAEILIDYQTLINIDEKKYYKNLISNFSNCRIFVDYNVFTRHANKYGYNIFQSYDIFEDLFNKVIVKIIPTAIFNGHNDYNKLNVQMIEFYKENYLTLFKVKDPQFYDKDICTEGEILPFLNENSSIIDEDKYNELRKIGKTNNNDNIVLLMELMSNFNVDKSFDYLLLLLYEFQSYFRTKKEIDHVNFKSLLTSLNIEPYKFKSFNLSFVEVINIAKSNNKFTKTFAFLLSGLSNGSISNYDSNISKFFHNDCRINYKNLFDEDFDKIRDV